MNDETQKYLAALAVPTPFVERVERALSAFEFLLRGTAKPSETIDRVFLCDGVNNVGEQSLLSCWGFSETFWFEARNFLTEDNADISPYRNSIWYLGMDYSNLTLGAPCVESSKLKVEVAMGRLDSGNKFSASGVNCQYLLDIVNQVLLPNVAASLS